MFLGCPAGVSIRGAFTAASASGMGEGSCLSLLCLQSTQRRFETLNKLLKTTLERASVEVMDLEDICPKPNPNLCRGAPGKAFLYPKDGVPQKMGLRPSLKEVGRGKHRLLRDWTS